MCFARLYDTLTGQLESMDILSPDTKIVHLESPCISLDLFVQGSSLFLPLGVVSRDTLIQKVTFNNKANNIVVLNFLHMVPIISQYSRTLIILNNRRVGELVCN